MLLDGLFSKNQTQQMQYAKYMDNSIPLFSQYGKDIYASDIVQTCIDCIATECSKLQPRHIRRDLNNNIMNLDGDNINRLFKFKPNPLMSTRDFIERIIWNLYLNYNSFIYPAYDVVTDARGNTSRNYTAFWPLNPVQVDWVTDLSGALFVKFTFENGSRVTLPYDDVIHIRKKYSVNDYMGGGRNGKPDNNALIKTLQISDTLLDGTSKAITASLGVRGILKMNTVLEDEKQTAERKALEQRIADSQSGIITGDPKTEFVPIDLNPKIIDADTLKFIQDKILRWYGVSLPILDGTYTDDQYQAFYNKALEPNVIAMNQAFSSTLFSDNQISFNHEITFYHQKLELMGIQNKLAIMDGLGNRGALSNNQLLALFGIEPYEGGDTRMASLNYIDATLMNAYQMKGIVNNNNQGGTQN